MKVPHTNIKSIYDLTYSSIGDDGNEDEVGGSGNEDYVTDSGSGNRRGKGDSRRNKPKSSNKGEIDEAFHLFAGGGGGGGGKGEGEGGGGDEVMR